MKIQIWSVGKAHESFVKEGIEMFTKRTNHYFPAEWNIISGPKKPGSEISQLKQKEGEIILSAIAKEDYLVLLDEKGKSVTSEVFSMFLEQRAISSVKNLIFLIGGAYGVSEAVMKRADFTWSLSRLVFPHQLVRLIVAEQLYRACSIIRNEKYHHS